MPVLMLLALGLGTALAVYEFSPRVRASANDYANALRAAHAAHVAADAHLYNAGVAASVAATHAQTIAAVPPPTPAPTAVAPTTVAPTTVAPTPAAPMALTPEQTAAAPVAAAAQAAINAALDHAVAAVAANQVAAQNTVAAAQSAQTPEDRTAAAASAVKVTDRAQQIAAALASLGVGQCGVHTYPRVTVTVKDKLLAKLHAEGMEVTGDNPWNIETHQYSVRLRALWDPKTETLRLIVTAGQGGLFGLVTCDQIWGKIDPIVKGVIGGG